MAEQLTNYQCPNCGGKMYFSNATGKLQCDFCDSSFTVEEVEAFFAAKNQKASAAFDKEDAKASAEEAKATGGAVKDKSQKNIASAEKQVKSASSKWDEATISSDWGELGDDVKSYVCPSCGGEIICDNNTAATNCPYCGNNTIVPGQLSGSLKPDYIIPFKLDKQAAIAALKKHYGKRLFLPKEFKDKNTIEKIQGIYVPFWLFDADVQIRGDFEGKRSTSHRQGDYIVTTTKHYDITRGGHFSFDLVPADASAKMPDDLMDSIEPYDYKEMVPFTPGYLPGYLADKYDVDIKTDSGRVNRRCYKTVEQAVSKTVTGYDSV
ncbi:MAG: hypothetical protein HUJ75_02565, partial [Parasporobacterium sp.]|nr:hypothetical protein [Parasporobacterium sp.]